MPNNIPQAGLNATPVVAALINYTIPPNTPFALTGSATDADAVMCLLIAGSRMMTVLDNRCK
jgi:hypothetical protein